MTELNRAWLPEVPEAVQVLLGRRAPRVRGWAHRPGGVSDLRRAQLWGGHGDANAHTDCQAPNGTGVAQEPESRPELSVTYRYPMVKHEPELHREQSD